VVDVDHQIDFEQGTKNVCPLRSYRGLSSFSIICQPLWMPFASCSSIKTSCLRSAKRLRQPLDLIYCSYSTYDVPPIAGPAGCATLVKPKRDSFALPPCAPRYSVLSPHTKPYDALSFSRPKRLSRWAALLCQPTHYPFGTSLVHSLSLLFSFHIV
jgi:hypothetical protein